MLVLSLLLVLAAAGVLVASVLVGEPQWAWISVVCSGLAGALLLAERFRWKRTTPSGARPRHALTRRAGRLGRKKSGADSEAPTATMAPVATAEGSAGGSPESDGSAESDGSPEADDSPARDGDAPTGRAEDTAVAKGDTDRHETAAAASGATVTGTAALSDTGADDPPGPEVPAAVSEDAGADSSDAEPDEEQTNPADVALISETDDQVVVIDERPRYHLSTCEWLGSRRTIPLPVREARELAFSPCARCKPDASLMEQLRGRG
ncbi:hypothetical protein GIY23_16350 [Allosaccharopolyspora coralli]|uniref:Uncharacterized protein n=1 Tax=Allosaccharopolyspora coralli TaxID=2665642 RepID=A0A5Q3QGH7_9PSEU|nr:hypothetical protein GIY23_16350 [Allosaccharopolyspora coralli]